MDKFRRLKTRFIKEAPWSHVHYCGIEWEKAERKYRLYSCLCKQQKAGVTATVSVTGMGAYRGTLIKNFKITAVPQKDQVYTLGDLKYKIHEDLRTKMERYPYVEHSKRPSLRFPIPATVRSTGWIYL